MYIESVDILATHDDQNDDIARDEIVIRGVTTSGHIFRPSDWAERLAGILSTFDIDNRLGYSPYMQPAQVGGIKSVIVSKSLKEIDSRAYGFVLGFARDNNLLIEDAEARHCSY
jgi:Protein of unknown function (DUF3579)